MVFNIIPFFVIVISLIIIVYIIGKKVPKLRLIDTSTIREEKESSVKKKILEVRWQRAINGLKKFFIAFTRPILGKVFRFFLELYKRVMELEKIYTKALRERKEEKIDPRARLANYLEKGDILKAEGKSEAAEDYYIRALEIDDKNVFAYRGLAELYVERKDYGKAVETMNFLIRLFSSSQGAEEENPERRSILAKAYADVSEVEEILERHNEALQNIKKAHDLEPNNPRFLDLLLNFSIIVKDKKLAQDALWKLREANPENQKLDELERKVQELSD